MKVKTMTKLVDHSIEIVIICLRPTRSSDVTIFQINFFLCGCFFFPTGDTWSFLQLTTVYIW